ncbi:MAG: DegT/DnrJ/EryC1/StrS family aminotransferase, partial [Bacteroidales bacterium]
FKGKFNGTYCDAAFFSTQWNKPFSTGVGGYSYISNAALNAKVIEENKNRCQPSLMKKISLTFQLFIRKTLLTDYTYWTLVPLYRMLSRNNIVLGSSSGTEISSAEMPHKYSMGMSNVQAKAGIKNIKRLSELLKLRKTNAEKYTHFLKEQGLNHPAEELCDNHAFLKYPLLVKDKMKVMTLAEKQKISLGDWLNSPLHPIQEHFETWEMNIAEFPKAAFAGQHMINLPLESNVDKTKKFIISIQEYIYRQQEIEELY